MQQDIHGQGKGWQTEVNASGTAYVADTIHIHPPRIQHSATGIPHNLPYSGVTEFVGREADLKQLHQQVQTGTTVAISAISGMGGIGKTELALQYAYQHVESPTYPGGICWLRAREDLGIQIVSFAQTGLDLSPPEDLELAEKVTWCWQHWRQGAVLVVLDDVQDYQNIRSLLPAAESRFRIVLTTRLQLGSPVQNLEIKVLTPTASLALLRSLVTDERIDQQIDEANQICEWLGYLPLGLELVGRYLARKPDTSLTTLWQRLQDKRLEAKALKDAEPEMTASLGVTAAFELSWEALSESAQQLAALLSLFALAEIPWTLVEPCLPDWDTEDLEDLRDRELLGWHLLQRTGAGMHQLHQLLREFFAAKRSQMPAVEALQPQFFNVMLTAARRSTETPTRSLIQETEIVIPHLQAAIDRAASAQQEVNVALGLSWLAELYRKQGRYSDAEPLLVRSLSIREQQLGANHPDTAGSLNDLAGLYYFQGRYSEAEPLHVRSLSIREQQLGADHPNVATSLNNLAELYRLQGRYSEAEPLYERSLAISEQQLGADHPAVATSLNNLANLYYFQGRYSEAEPLYGRSLSIREQQLGADHPNVATSLNDLAELYQSQGRYSEAEPLYMRSLSIREQQLGADHPDVATSLNNLANLYQSQGRYSEAEPLYMRSLSIMEQQLGADHPDVAQSLNNLAGLYESQGRYSEAEPLYVRSLAIREQQLGAGHPDVAQSLNNLAGLYREQGRYSEAEPLHVRSLSIREQQLGAEHPDVASSLNGLASLYKAQGRYSEAEPLYVRTLAICEQQLGAEHPDVASSLNNLAGLYYFQGRYSEAEPLYVRSLSIMEQQLGADHPHVAYSLNNLAGLYTAQERYSDAEPLYMRTLAIFMTVLGANHPRTRSALSNFCHLVRQAVAAGRTGELSDHPGTQAVLQALADNADNAAE
jgi:tetratricopeptide (TPR) repeat protein